MVSPNLGLPTSRFPNWKGTSVILDIGLIMVCLWSVLSGSHCSGRKLGPWRKQSTWPQKALLKMWTLYHTRHTERLCLASVLKAEQKRRRRGQTLVPEDNTLICVRPPFPHSRNGVNMATTVHRTPDISSSSPSLLSHEVSSLGPGCESFAVCCLPHSGPTATGPIRHRWEPPKLPAKINLFSL